MHLIEVSYPAGEDIVADMSRTLRTLEICVVPKAENGSEGYRALILLLIEVNQKNKR